MMKSQIKNAIVSESFDIANGWIGATSDGAHNYIDVFENAYPNKMSVIKATVTPALDDNRNGKCLRLYVCIRFAERFPTPTWLDDYFVCTSGESISGFHIEQRGLRANATKSGNAIHAILEDEDWTKWTEADLKRNLKVLRECCRKLCQWTEAYVNSLS